MTRDPPSIDVKKPITVLVAEDHFVVRQGLRSILESAGLTLVAEARSGTEAVARFLATRPDVCILDVRMPDMDGIVAMGRILDIDKSARIIALSSHEGDADIKRAPEAGAATYVLKRSLDADLPDLVRVIAGGAIPSIVRYAAPSPRPLRDRN